MNLRFEMPTEGLGSIPKFEGAIIAEATGPWAPDHPTLAATNESVTRDAVFLKLRNDARAHGDAINTQARLQVDRSPKLGLLVDQLQLLKTALELKPSKYNFAELESTQAYLREAFLPQIASTAALAASGACLVGSGTSLLFSSAYLALPTIISSLVGMSCVPETLKPERHLRTMFEISHNYRGGSGAPDAFEKCEYAKRISSALGMREFSQLAEAIFADARGRRKRLLIGKSGAV